jgi:hypothetical protein
VTRWRAFGLPVIIGGLLTAGAVKLWSVNATALAVGGALLGAGLVLLGIATRDWITPPPQDRREDVR